MLAVLETATVFGLDVIPVRVEVDIAPGLPGMTIVGLPDKAVEEARERVKAALTNSGFRLPARRITINLAPADVKKEGSSFDLPIAIGILSAQGILPTELFKKMWVLGELGLTGDIQSVTGVLPIAIAAEKQGIKGLVVPQQNLSEALVQEGEVVVVSNITEFVDAIKTTNKLPTIVKSTTNKLNEPVYEYDFAYVKGQESGKRALEIAAAGGHNVLLSGPPGSGKTLLARCLPSILPSMTKEEQIEVSAIYSVCGLLQGAIMHERPFRSPHHTTSQIALVGGGSIPRPGEVTLAHRGVLFLDELPEFPRFVLEGLRQPLEDGVVTIARIQGRVSFPARFTLIAAQNPCPCGFLTDPTHDCTCSPSQIQRYQKKISGPLLDRIDLHIEVPRVTSKELTTEAVAESSILVKERVMQAREIQIRRYKSSLITNATLTSQQIKKYIPLSNETKQFIEQAIDSMNLSARAFVRILKVARTIADLKGEQDVITSHIAEALQYRPNKKEY